MCYGTKQVIKDLAGATIAGIVSAGIWVFIVTYLPGRSPMLMLIKMGVGTAAFFLVYYWLLSKVNKGFELSSWDPNDAS